jgi:light-regulated signal transduction histidine kinase (bacteriophytochrome)
LEATGQFFRDQLAAEQSVIRTENRYRAGSYKWLSWNLVIFAAEGVTYGFARNFISNAIKYQNPEAETSYVQFDIVVDANQARITITDNGIGVEEQFVPHLFDMFFRATETAEGSGLGLYIVKQAAQRIGGFIAVTSQLGIGTEFVITLPNQLPAVTAETVGQLHTKGVASV